MLFRAGSKADKLKQFITSLPSKLWLARDFPGPRYRLVTSNIVESLNNRILVIDSIRELHPLEILNSLRLIVIEDRAERLRIAQARIDRGEGQNIPRLSQYWLTEYARGKLLLDVNAQARDLRVQINRQGVGGICEASVTRGGGNHTFVYTVNLATRFCTCLRWLDMEFPCSHGVAALKASGHEVIEFMGEAWLQESVKRAYLNIIDDQDHTMRPVSLMNLAVGDITIVPRHLFQNRPGRKQTARKEKGKGNNSVELS
jgi:hypothetical protein